VQVVVTLYDPQKLATLRPPPRWCAAAVTFDGYRLTIQAAEGEKSRDVRWLAVAHRPQACFPPCSWIVD
jgi:hypothetical protein